MAYGEILAALNDPTRRRILELLRVGPRAVGELALELPVSRPAVSQHLRVLAATELVAVQSAGTRRIYRVRPEGLEPLRRYLEAFWGDALRSFQDHVRRSTQENDE
jgi:DNA-binding transcriptional ArsR family regulator